MPGAGPITRVAVLRRSALPHRRPAAHPRLRRRLAALPALEL